MEDRNEEGLKDEGDGLYNQQVHLSEAVNMSDLCSEAGTIFEVSTEDGEVAEEKMRTFFDDDTVISSLSLGAGNCIFSDDEEDVSSGDDGLEPFEKLAQKMEDMTEDGGVLKMEVRSGIGGDIPNGASVVFHYNAFLEYSDEPFDSSHLRNKPERKVLDSGDMLPGLNIALKTMRKGQTARFLIRPKYAFGEMGCYPRIPGNETILYEINVISFVDRAAADAYEDMDQEAQTMATFKEKIKAARSYHRQGNEQFRDGFFSSAKSFYYRASWILENARLMDEEEEQQRDALLGKMRSNLAQVFLELKEPNRACTQCKLGLGLARGLNDDLKAKILYRFGKAKGMLNDFRGAHKELRRAQQLKPNNAEISKEIEALLLREEKFAAKEKFMCQKMFNTEKDTSHNGKV